jgi:hypothetical protein
MNRRLPWHIQPSPSLAAPTPNGVGMKRAQKRSAHVPKEHFLNSVLASGAEIERLTGITRIAILGTTFAPIWNSSAGDVTCWQMAALSSFRSSRVGRNQSHLTDRAPIADEWRSRYVAGDVMPATCTFGGTAVNALSSITCHQRVTAELAARRAAARREEAWLAREAELAAAGNVRLL